MINLNSILGAVAGAAAMYVVWMLYQPFHDAAVTREARRQYVAISELEGEKARARATQQLLDAERRKTADNEALLKTYTKAVEVAMQEIREANIAEIEELQNEIYSARPGVPTVRDLGVKLRN